MEKRIEDTEKIPVNEAAEQKIARLEKKVAELESRNEKLTNDILYLRRQLYGRSSERFVPEAPSQLSIAFEGVESLPEEQEAQVEEITVTYTRKKESMNKPVREAIPDNLRREEETIEPENIPEGAIRIGEEITEKLEYIPGEVYVKRTIRPKYAQLQGEGIVIGELPTQVLPRSNIGASLLSHLLVSKYQDHQPFYRQLDIFKRQDVHLAASTVNGWFQDGVDLLRPLYETLRKQVLSSDYIQIDESTIPVVDQDKPGATRKGYHWIVKSPVQNQLFFHYQHGSRAQYVVVQLLRDFRGAIQSDGYGAYNIYENKKDVLLLGCMAHSRRKFEISLKNDPERAGHALKVMQSLYAIEREAQETNLSPDGVKALRQEKSYPILKAFEKWLYAELNRVLPKSPIGQAIQYTYTIYPRLVRYVLDGRYQIDNNGAENGVRVLALGRKNYLFCGNHEAAERTAVIYSLLGSCRLAGVNPEAWLTDVLGRIPDHSVQRLDELLPINWKQTKQKTTKLLPPLENRILLAQAMQG
jgi:transposase